MTMTDAEAWALEEKFSSGNINLSGKPGTGEMVRRELAAAM
jgi:hypothetical protein